jgi:hypothetical protein
MDDISRKYLGGGKLFLVANTWPINPLNTITIDHITGLPDSNGGILTLGNLTSNPEMYGFVFTNSIVTAGRNPVWNMGGGRANCAFWNVPFTSLNACFASYTFANNAVVAAPSHYPPSSWPGGNQFVLDMNNVGFVQPNGGNAGNYQLQPTSPFKNKGADGKDLGADIVGLNHVLMGVE